MVATPPPRPNLSAFQQTRRFFKQPFELLSQTRQQCGDVFSLHILGMGHLVVVCSAELMAKVHQRDEDALSPGAIRQQLFASIVGKRLSLGMDGKIYRQRRRQLTPFFGGRRVAIHTNTIRRLTEDMLRGWNQGQRLGLQAEFDRLALRVVSRILFGDTEASSAERLFRRADDFLSTLQSPFVQAPFLRIPLGPLTPYGRYLAARDRLFSALRDEIEDRGEREGDDLLGTLITQSRQDSSAMQMEDIVQEMAGFLIGGSETTSKALGWTFLGLSTQPRLITRLRQELVAVIGQEGISQGDMARLPYLTAVVQEGLRWQPAAPLVGFRRVDRDIEVGDFLLEKGQMAAQALRETGRNELFVRPTVFDPESHFLGRKIPMSKWLPFGGGQRMCMGMALAQLEMGVILATLFQRSELELLDKSCQPQPDGIAFQPKGGLPVKVRTLRSRIP